MKKRLKKIGKIIGNNIFGFIIGAIVFGSIGVYAATTIASSIITYDNSKSGGSSTTVQGAVDELYNLAKSTEFKVGDYVSMTPTKTSFSIPMTLTEYFGNQTINPSELKLWRVIRINSDGTVDMVSEYVSSVTVSFKGKTGYQNFVGTLNYIAKQYENQKYTSGSRHMGYNGQTEYITDTSALTGTPAPQTSSTSSSNVTSSTEAIGLGDMGYQTDYDLVNTAVGTLVAKIVGTTTATDYWLASRYYDYGSYWSRWDFYGRGIVTSGGVGNSSLYSYDSGFSARLNGRAVRPIVTLKSGVKASSGSGTSASPYVLP